MTTNKYWLFLEGLRRTGIVNMYGASPILEEAFGLKKREAVEVLTDWMKNYNPSDYTDEAEEAVE